MKITKHVSLLVSASVAALLVIVAVIMAARAAFEFGKVKGSLREQQNQLQALENRKPYPSQSNIEKLLAEQGRLDLAQKNLEKELSRQQPQPTEMEPAQFRLRVENIFRGLHERALANNVMLPERFTFGFDRYVRNLPEPEFLPRLQMQVSWIEDVCKALLDARVHEVISIERHVFEEEAEHAAEGGAAAPMGAGPSLRERMTGGERSGGSEDLMQPAKGYLQDPDGLFVRERMVFTFSAREAAVWKVLNSLPKIPSFNVLAAVEFQNESKRPERIDVKTGTVAATPAMGGLLAGGADTPPMAPPTTGGTNAAPRMLSVNERVVAGRADLIRVRMVVDFYQFKVEAEESPKETAS